MSGERVLVVVPGSPAGTAHLRAGSLAKLAHRYRVVLAVLGDAEVPSGALEGEVELVRLAPESSGRRRARHALRDIERRRGRAGTRRLNDAHGLALAVERGYHGAARTAAVAAASLPGVAIGASAALRRLLGLDPALTALVERVRPRLVIGHHVGYESATIDVVAAARAGRVPVMLLQGVWEAFSGGPPLPQRPDYFGVWGLQSAMWAEMLEGIRKNRMFLTGPPFPTRVISGDERAARCRELGLAADAPLVVLDEGVEPRLAGHIGDAVRERTLPPCAVTGLDGVRTPDAALAAAAVVVTREPEHALRAVARGVAAVAVGAAGARSQWDLPVAAFLRGMPGCFPCVDAADAVSAVRHALTFVAEPGAVASMRAHATVAAYADGFDAGDRVRDAVDAVVLTQEHRRHHYLRDPIIDVESKDNVVKDFVPAPVGAYSEARMIDSEEA